MLFIVIFGTLSLRIGVHHCTHHESGAILMCHAPACTQIPLAPQRDVHVAAIKVVCSQLICLLFILFISESCHCN